MPNKAIKHCDQIFSNPLKRFYSFCRNKYSITLEQLKLSVTYCSKNILFKNYWCMSKNCYELKPINEINNATLDDRQFLHLMRQRDKTNSKTRNINYWHNSGKTIFYAKIFVLH